MRSQRPKSKKSDPAVQLTKRFSQSDTPEKPKTVPKRGIEYDPLATKGRVAHRPASTGENVIPLTVVPIPGCIVPSAIRHRQLNALYTALTKHVHLHNDNNARQCALEEKFKPDIRFFNFKLSYFL